MWTAPSAFASLAHSVFQEIGGASKAFGGFGHLGGDRTGSTGILRSEDHTKVSDQ
jgi:hypothetical protein